MANFFLPFDFADVSVMEAIEGAAGFLAFAALTVAALAG
jgi:hypothetical protein